MAIAGTITYRNTRDQIIEAALRKLGAVDPENATVATAIQITNGAETLNQLVKFWEAKGLQLWERKYGVIFPQRAQKVYVLGSPGPAGDHACLSTPIGTGFVRTTLTAAIAANATTASLTSISTASSDTTVGVPAVSIVSGDYIGLQQTDGTMFWTTVNGAPVGLNVTLTAGPPEGCASGATVNSYHTKMVRPLRVLDGMVEQVGRNRVPCKIIPREQYNRFGMPHGAATTTQLYYDPQENTGHLYTYPTTLDVRQLLYIEFQNPISDFASSTDDYDLPQEWGLALVYNLAWMLAPEYSLPQDKYNQIKELAIYTRDQLDGWDQEHASVYMQPETWIYDGGR